MLGSSATVTRDGPEGRESLLLGFAAELQRRGYAADTVARQTRMFAGLLAWLDGEGVELSGLSIGLVRQFCAARRTAGHRDYVSVRGLRALLVYLEGRGAAQVGAAQVAGPVEELLDRFASYLVGERRLASESVATYVTRARPLVEALGADGELDLALLEAVMVRRFVVEHCPGMGRSAAKLTVVAIRSLLGFLYVEGEIDRPLARAVPAVASWRLAGLPKRLEPEQVVRLLGSCDRATATGRRDFAILTVLTRLGVRVGELAGLMLEDIDWRAGEITVHGKGRAQRLPLPADVGAALIDYLQHGRPARAEDRAVFVRAVVPHHRLSRTGIGQIVRVAGRRAGIGEVNAHRLRHTAASAMIAAGGDLVEVGQVLGHCQLETTAIYAKCDRETLRQIARLWPGVTA